MAILRINKSGGGLTTPQKGEKRMRQFILLLKGKSCQVFAGIKELSVKYPDLTLAEVVANPGIIKKEEQ